MRRTVITKFYCKVRTANGTTDLQSNEGGDLCELVGSTDNGRQIWRWTGPAVSEPQPVEIIFTNHDLLTDIMAFDNGGYYNYASHLYNAGQTTGVPVIDNGQWTIDNDAGATGWFDLRGRRLAGKPTQKGLYIYNGKKQVVRH